MQVTVLLDSHELEIVWYVSGAGSSALGLSAFLAAVDLESAAESGLEQRYKMVVPVSKLTQAREAGLGEASGVCVRLRQPPRLYIEVRRPHLISVRVRACSCKCY